jgi:hypothetical protein
MDKALRHEDGSLISAATWQGIRMSAKSAISSYLKGLGSSTEELKKTYYCNNHRTAWNKAIQFLEAARPLVGLCANHWKAEHVLSDTLDSERISKQRKEKAAAAKMGKTEEQAEENAEENVEKKVRKKAAKKSRKISGNASTEGEDFGDLNNVGNDSDGDSNSGANTNTNNSKGKKRAAPTELAPNSKKLKVTNTKETQKEAAQPKNKTPSKCPNNLNTITHDNP